MYSAHRKGSIEPDNQALLVQDEALDLDNNEEVGRVDSSEPEIHIDVEILEPDNSSQTQRWRLSSWIFYIIAVIAALGTAMYAFLEPSNSNIDDVSEQWWEEMPTATKALSIATAVDTQIVYTVFFSFFIENAFYKLKESMTKYFHSCKDFTINTTTVLLSTAAGLANAAIIYPGFLWLPLGRVTALFPTTFNFLVVFASRYVGLGNITTRVLDLVDNDARLQRESVLSLKHIKAELIDQMNELLEGKPYDEETLLELLQALSTHVDAVDQASRADYVKEVSGLLFDVIFAITILVPAFMLFAQKGFDGVELLDNDRLRNADPMVKILVGTLPGVVSSIFIALNAFDFRKVVIDLVKHLGQHPKDIPIAIIALFMNIFTAGSGWRNVATSTITPANIFSLTSKTSNLAQAYIYINTISSCVTTYKPMCLKIIESKAPATKLEGMIDWAKKNRISHVAAEQIRRYSLFGSSTGGHEQPNQLIHGRDRPLMSQLESIDSPSH